MNKLLALMMAGMLAFSGMQNIADLSAEPAEQQVSIEADVEAARAELLALGITVSDAAVEAVNQIFVAWMPGTNTSPAVEWLLSYDGFGHAEYDEDTYEQISWTPTSNQVYAFDAEVYDVERMYTWLLLGVESIVPGLHFDDVTEDLSAIVELDFDYEALYDEDGNLKDLTEEELALLFQPMPEDQGNRSVSFTVNGHPYTLMLKNFYDWVDIDVIDKLNAVLAAEGIEHRLSIVSDPLSQIVILYYGDDATTEALQTLLNP